MDSDTCKSLEIFFDKVRGKTKSNQDEISSDLGVKHLKVYFLTSRCIQWLDGLLEITQPSESLAGSPAKGS